MCASYRYGPPAWAMTFSGSELPAPALAVTCTTFALVNDHLAPVLALIFKTAATFPWPRGRQSVSSELCGEFFEPDIDVRALIDVHVDRYTFTRVFALRDLSLTL